MQVARKTSSVGMLRPVILYKQQKQRWHTRDQPFANLTNGIARCLLTLTNTVFKIRKDNLKIIFFLMAIFKISILSNSQVCK